MASYTGSGGHVVPAGQSAPSPHWPGPDWSAVPQACPAANLARAAGGLRPAPRGEWRQPWVAKERAGGESPRHQLPGQVLR